jgi:hypothetical protein
MRGKSPWHLDFSAGSTVAHAHPYCAVSCTLMLPVDHLFARAEIPLHAIQHVLQSGQLILPREVRGLPARTSTFSCGGCGFICATTANPAHGICERQIQRHKNKGWQDRLAPVLGAMSLIIDDFHANGTTGTVLNGNSTFADR